MEHRVAAAKALVRIARELVAMEITSGGRWRLVRVDYKTGRETTQGFIDFDDNSTDKDKMLEMEMRIKRIGWDFPDDCDIYPGEDQYLVMHDDGRIEWRMFKISPDSRAVGGKSHWKIFKFDESGNQRFHRKINLTTNGTVREKQTQLLLLMRKIGIHVERHDIVFENDDEFSIYKGGRKIYRIVREYL